MQFEAKHLLKKLKERDLIRFRLFEGIKEIAPHPIFNVVNGEFEEWKIV